MSRDIGDYALIGDCETAALVGRDASIEWLCWPRFDSPACMAALLGQADNGCWRMEPVDDVRHRSRAYRPGTLILENVIETAEGRVRLIDFMPLRKEASDVVRIVVGEAGRVTMRSILDLRYDYGRIRPWLERRERGISAVAGPNAALLDTPVDNDLKDGACVAEFTVNEGERVPFVLTYFASHKPTPEAVDAEVALKETEAYWTKWVGKGGHEGPWSEAVERSLITLKALTYRPTGGVIAAPTTSLPEQWGGSRNWDYRFCWLRDATFTLLALLDAGHRDEAEAWRDWLLRAIAGEPAKVQPVYGLAGEHRLTEWEADWLPGFEGAGPVRIGNSAFQQDQLDIIGEVLDALHQAREVGLKEGDSSWEMQTALVEHVERSWRQPDAGIWESRGVPRRFVHSQVMAWSGVDRMIKAAERLGLEGPLDRWRTLRDEIHREVCLKGFDPGIGAFTRAFGSKDLDAATLMIPMVGFLPANDPRVVGTVEAIQKHLMPEGLVLRYKSGARDGVEGKEGAFLACSFWLVDCLVLMDRRQEAQALFERLLDLRNDVGLLAEEYDPKARRQLGNFPQALSHVALVDSAYNLSRSRGPAKERGESGEEGLRRAG